MSKKTKWLDRCLIESPVFYCLCKNKKQFKRTLKQINYKDKKPFVNNGSNATTHFFSSAGASVAIVCIDKCKSISDPQINALLTHEAVHIWQDIKDNIGEKYPSHEFEAYSIQAIAQNLMVAYYE